MWNEDTKETVSSSTINRRQDSLRCLTSCGLTFLFQFQTQCYNETVLNLYAFNNK